MLCFDMVEQSFTVMETLVTCFADVRPVPGVNSSVTLQVTRTDEGLLAELAFVWFHAGVTASHMNSQWADGRKCGITKLTLVRLFTGMGSAVA